MAYNEISMSISIKHGNKKFIEVFNDFQGREIYHSLISIAFDLRGQVRMYF